MALESMLNMQMIMFLLVIIGFVIRKKGIIGECPLQSFLPVNF